MEEVASRKTRLSVRLVCQSKAMRARGSIAEVMAIDDDMEDHTYLLLPRSVGNFAVANAIYGSCVFVCQVVHQGVYR